MTPRLIAAILDSPVYLFIARAVLAFTFLVPGIMQAVQFQAAQGEFAHFGLNPPAVYVAASIITLLIGSALVIIGGRWTWLGAGALGIYCGLTIIIVHHFWRFEGAQQLEVMRVAFEHISIIGGMMVVAALEHHRAKLR